MLSLVGRPVAVNPDAVLRSKARAAGWEIRDFRTGRKAAKVGVPSALGVGALTGAAVTVAVRRRRSGPAVTAGLRSVRRLHIPTR